MMKKIISITLVIFMLCSLLGVNPSGVEGGGIAFAASGNSGIDMTLVNGVKTVHAYDNFSDRSLNSDVWVANNHFQLDTRNDRLYTETQGRGNLELQGNYSGYDHYEVSLDLVDFDSSYSSKSNGGIGISGDGELWSFHETLERSYSGYNTYYSKVLNVQSYLTDALRSNFTFYNWKHTSNNNTSWWIAQPISMKITADKNSGGSGYDVSVHMFHTNYPSNGDIANYTFTTSELNFEDIYISDFESSNDWYVIFDNFDFKATKTIEFKSLEATWNNHNYELTWDAVDGATDYDVYYLTKRSNGSIIYNKYNASADEISARKVTIADTSSEVGHPFIVRAILDAGTVDSNEVYVDGVISDRYTLIGEFSGEDYSAIWQTLNVGTNAGYTYSLYYGDTESSVDTLVPGAGNLSSSNLDFLFENIDTSAYYGKYLQLVARVDYTDMLDSNQESTTPFYSNIIKVERAEDYNIQLTLNHVNDYYVFRWAPAVVFDNYNLYRDADVNNLDPIASSVARESVANAPIDGYITKMYADTDATYQQKYFVVGGNDSGKMYYSNIVSTAGDVAAPTLTWSKSGSQHTLSWSSFAGAEKIEIYSGVAADAIATLVSDSNTLLATNQYISSDSSWDGDYFRVRFLKNNVWYYSNIVKALYFDYITATFVTDTLDASKVNFNIDWEDVSGKDHYELYYINGDGVETVIASNLSSSAYTISDIYGVNKTYLRKSLYVKAVCPITDQFGMDYDYVLTSPVVV
ncbi:MAG: hypothetical protein JXO44_09840, partial [Clostridia bacterium]|nr:hypothetical protein [Clostridia bacterium]